MSVKGETLEGDSGEGLTNRRKNHIGEENYTSDLNSNDSRRHIVHEDGVACRDNGRQGGVVTVLQNGGMPFSSLPRTSSLLYSLSIS